jgi:arylsulfatase A-like enzyme
MTDQQRWDALGCVNPVVQTPVLDALAARGVCYSQAVCNAPICVPSRYSMMTGLYPSQVGVRRNDQFCLEDDDLPLPVLPQLLHDAGYQTAGFGKTHWYPLHLTKDSYEGSCRGFEIRKIGGSRDSTWRAPEIGARYQDQDEAEWVAKRQAERAPFIPGGESKEGYVGIISSVPAAHHMESWLTRQAIDFLENGRDAERPWFLYLSFGFPHPPFNVPPGYEALYNIEDIEVPEQPEVNLDGHSPRHGDDVWPQLSNAERRLSTLRYYALCSYVDELFGRILSKVDELGELENTYVIFAADHGDMMGDRGRVSKFCLYEGSVRVPLIIAGPNLPEGAVDDRPAELVDVLPTILELVGLEVPLQLSGGSLLRPPVRTGQFCELHGRQGEIQSAPAYMWRSGGWKLIQYLPNALDDALLRVPQTKGELYNLEADPLETDNLYDKPTCSTRREQMTRELLMHLAVTWTKYPRQFAPDLG